MLLPFALIKLHLIRHATRDTFSRWRRLGVVVEAIHGRPFVAKRCWVGEGADPYDVG